GVERQLETSRLLASHLLVSGNDLYFKTGGRIFSMDLLSIELNWSTSRPPTRTTRRSANRVQRFNPWSTPQANTPAAEEARRVEAALSDGVAAAISIAHGLVFELVPEPWDSSNPFRTGIPGTRRASSMQPRENTLVARELHERDQVWALGTGAGASRPPHEMIFTSTPLAVGDALLVTYRDGQDFYAGLLDPFDGGIELKRVYLCTMTPGFLDVPDLLPPAADDQFAYIPTNAGLLLAVNLGDLSLRWASRYERRSPPTPTNPWPISVPRGPAGPRDRWLAGPPVVAGTVVVLAPADSDYLFAFNRATGHILWKKNRGGHNYIVAVDGPSVWLGGRYLTKIDLATGKSDWQIETPSATGRAVLSGRRVLVPTRDGLLMVNADSGEDAETQPLPPNHAPLGRLLCWDGALYSLDTEQIRKFPDLEQSYEPAKAKHAADPTDAPAAIRLAWMELLRQQPDRVLETLERVATDDTPQGRRQSAHIAHLRVEALLAGATSSNLSSAEAEARLRRALAIAESAEDRFNATSALADQLVRNDKPDEAYQYVWWTAALGTMSELEQQTTGCKRSMRETLTEKLAEISASLPDAQKERMAELLFAETALDETPGRQNRRRLEQRWAWLSEGDDLAHWNQRAALQLGRLYQGRRKYEAAEYYYRKASELNLDPQLTAAAASGLAEMYVEQTPEARFAPIADDAAVVLPTQPVSEGRLLQIATDQAAEPTDLFYVFAPPNNLFAHRFSDGQRVWPTQLRLPTESSLENETPPATRIQERPPQAKTDGQILITNTETGLHAVGMITGRRLWSIPIEVPAPQQQHIADGSLFDVRDGKVVVRVSAHQLDVVRVVDGHDRLWSARLQDHIIGSVRIAGDRVIAFDHMGTVAKVFDLQSGKQLFEISIADGENETDSLLMLYANTLCILENGVLSGYDLKTGAKRWDRPVAFAVTRYFGAAQDCGVVGGSEGSVLAFRPDDGTVRYEGRVSSAPFGVSGGHAEDGTLFLFGRSETIPDSGLHVTALDLETQSVKWANPELGLSFCQKRFFDFLPDHFPVLYRRAQTGRPNVPAFLEQDRAYMILVNKRTGKRSGEPLFIPLVDPRQDLIGDLLIRPGRIVIGTNAGVHVLLLP
ncbi:MAG: PQQ-binding-like beta-propeller repeat protein, partial [Planctomycetes bacterium]|nr:PQQ-binding-like beta-propeller repeat protein [Planctomycetota bacterium]